MADYYPDSTIKVILDEHDGITIPVKKVGNYGWDTDNLTWIKLAANSNGELLTSQAPSSGVGDATATLSSAGSAQQLPAQACKRVIVQAHESNAGTVVIGGSTVVGALSGRRGKAIFATQSEVFYVSNLNQLYFDGTSSSDKIHLYYEN